MNTGHKWMGWWGSMGGPKQKGITQYVVSPMRQNPMRGAVKHWVTQGFSRTLSQTKYFVVPFAVAYAVMKWAVSDNELRNSKHGHAQGKFA